MLRKILNKVYKNRFLNLQKMGKLAKYMNFLQNITTKVVYMKSSSIRRSNLSEEGLNVLRRLTGNTKDMEDKKKQT